MAVCADPMATILLRAAPSRETRLCGKAGSRRPPHDRQAASPRRCKNGEVQNYVVADDGCLLWTEDSGRGDPLVLCHGGPGLWDYFDDVADWLSGIATVVRWDQRGCGRSQRMGPYT